MNKDLQSVIQAGLDLPSEDRLRLADKLYESVPEDDIARAWMEEVAQRASDWNNGKVEAADVEDVLKEARQRIAR